MKPVKFIIWNKMNGTSPIWSFAISQHSFIRFNIPMYSMQGVKSFKFTSSHVQFHHPVMNDPVYPLLNVNCLERILCTTNSHCTISWT